MDENYVPFVATMVPLLVAIIGLFVGYRGRVREEQERADHERGQREIAERSAYRRQNVLRRVLSWHHRVMLPTEDAIPDDLIADIEEETE